MNKKVKYFDCLKFNEKYIIFGLSDSVESKKN